jgi:hypothetical protein
MNYRKYLGDGLYADFDGYHIILAANNGFIDTNVVYLESEVLEMFYLYVKNIEIIKKQTCENKALDNVNFQINGNTHPAFTEKQIDHICYQIGEWYLMMKPLLEGRHNLGYMKEKLKTMICGE